MLFAEKADLFCVLAVQHAHAQPDIVARPKLIDQPADAVRVVGLMSSTSVVDIGSRCLSTCFVVAK